MATRLLHSANVDEPLGHKWISGFLRRNPRVKTIVGRRIEAVRLQETTTEAIQQFYDRLSHVRDAYNVQPQNIYNMDETGIALGVYTNS